MNKTYLELAHDKWGSKSDLVSKRNLAYAEMYDACKDYSFSPYTASWSRINLTLNVVRVPVTRQVIKLPQSCVDALVTYLEGMFDLYSRASTLLPDGVFYNNYKLYKPRNELEFQIQQLELSIADSYPIESLLTHHIYEEMRIKRDVEAARKKAKRLAKIAEQEALSAALASELFGKETKTTQSKKRKSKKKSPFSKPVEQLFESAQKTDDAKKTVPDWWVDSVKKYEKKLVKNYPMPDYMYLQLGYEWIEQKIADYGSIRVITRI